jgi:hypothetical protein
MADLTTPVELAVGGQIVGVIWVNHDEDAMPIQVAATASESLTRAVFRVPGYGEYVDKETFTGSDIADWRA